MTSGAYVPSAEILIVTGLGQSSIEESSSSDARPSIGREAPSEKSSMAAEDAAEYQAQAIV